ncbi:sce7725 family protein [Enterococcus ratti]|uniref:Uncharacterized protein n=1 Tax=Enterococcus ratti TaxID=150033 RepID=A0A1L8WSG7_9ENTE|nr:sce7725 family protein [Enterococcus ratti]OJG83964.1 hypothetical protein RV14_GL000141 [Enterococcus ratti]
MYYPYLRGKQFDLLALKESIQRNSLSKKVLPIIEPVRDSATLKNIVELFQKVNHPLIVVANPQVGQFKLFDERLHKWQLNERSSIDQAVIVTSNNYEKVISRPPKFIIFDGQHQIRDPQIWQKLLHAEAKILLPDSSRLRIWLPKNKIVIKEAFQPRKHSEDYHEKDDDFFSDDYLFFKEDGYIGFSDFTIEGSRYFDKGFPRRGLALHLTYVDSYGNIRVKHFVSDTNDSVKKQALKFFEAAEKMEAWVQRNKDQLLITSGLLELISLYQQKKFPGLGVLKKWTLLHHLELMSQLLDHPTTWLKTSSKIEELHALIYLNSKKK